MKAFSFIAILLLMAACTLNDEDKTQSYVGLVSFKTEPSYVSNNVQFKAQIQFASPGEAVDIEYQILDNTTVIASGKAPASVSDGFLFIFFETEMINVPISSTTYSGKKLTVLLDPSLKVTSNEFKSDVYLFYRKEEVTIP